MNNFELALKNVNLGDWERFERLCSKFLVDDYQDVRTLASSSGDGGRDAVLYSSDGSAYVVFQFSISKDWRAKVLKTCRQLKDKHPQVRCLQYLTNSSIGASGDELKKMALHDFGISVDVLDLSWFIERQETSRTREIAAKDFCSEVLPASMNFVSKSNARLSHHDAQAVNLALTFFMEDENREKDLLYSMVGTFVLGALASSTPENKILRGEVIEQVCKMLPSYPSVKIEKLVDRVLRSWNKVKVRWYKNEDAFCLTADERLSVAAHIVQKKDERLAVVDCINSFVCDNFDVNGKVSDVCSFVMGVLETFLFERGEHFVQALIGNGAMSDLNGNLRPIICKELAQNPLKTVPGDVSALVLAAISRVFEVQNTMVKNYLGYMSNVYTVFSLSRETQNVKGALRKVFSHGTIWLDANIVLPLFAELVLVDEDLKVHTNMIKSAAKVGLQLRITLGVLSEINGHLNRSIACFRQDSKNWRGSVPFVFASYVSSGRDIKMFPSWLEDIRGDNRPIDDIANYLREEYDIEVESLSESVDKTADELRWAVTEIFREVHRKRQERRLKNNYLVDEGLVKQLIEHDLENYLGVLQKRSEEPYHSLGYSSWWLTLDQSAFIIHNKLEEPYKSQIKGVPAMSLDFFSLYLSFGPTRSLLKGVNFVPIISNQSLHHFHPDLLELAASARNEFSGLSERVANRKIRDKIEKAKALRGDYSKNWFKKQSILDHSDAGVDDPLEG